MRPLSLRSDHDPHDRTRQSPLDKGNKFVYKHVQSGSAHVPLRGPPVQVQPNRTMEYIATVDATIIQPPTKSPQYQSWRRPKTLFVTRAGSPKRQTCFKCPSEQIVIAPRGTDAVLIKELPPVTNCHNQMLPRQQYAYQPLNGFAPFLLPQGAHSFLAKVVHLPSKQADCQLCTLNYRVMVHRCASYTVQNKALRMKCSLDNLWGSTCSFSCKDGGYMSLATSVSCNDHLEWSGEEPYCHYTADLDNEIPLASSCELPLPPKHGKFTCDTKARKLEKEALSERLPEDSTCRIKCNRHFEIPAHLEKYSRFSCQNGHWNSTMMEFCTRVRRKNN